MGVAGPAVVVSRDQAGPLALVIHEMATNAYKYGALSEPAGSVRLEWSCEADGGAQCIHVVWKEIGGPTVSVPRRRGFGHRMIEAAIPDARVDIVFEPDGLRYELVLPMAASAAAAGAGSSGTARKAG